MASLDEVSEFSEHVDSGEVVMKRLSEALITIANEFDEKQRKLDIAKVSLSSTGLAGGVMTVAGLALAPVTFGTSLGLTIAGGIVGGGSAIGNISALFADKIITKKSLENAQNLLNDFAKKSDVIQAELKRLIADLNEEERSFAESEIKKCPFLNDEMKKQLTQMLRDGQKVRITLQMKVVVPFAKEAVKHILSAAKILFKAGKAGKVLNGMASGAEAAAGAANAGKSIGTAADLGTDAAATTGKVASSGAKAAGIALAGVGIAIDFGALVYYSHKIHKNKPSQLAKKIRDVAECLQ